MKYTIDTVTHIYHISDLHIRNLKRHSEYRAVFQKFLNNVDADGIETSIIYIGGDIAHAKLEMSPELVREISWFLAECASRRETVLITGNHDCNLNNNSRLDVLTPIVENLKNPKIHYLRDSGVYPFLNLTFVVYSLLDDESNWPKPETVDGETKICLYHGAVNNAETDIGYTVISNSLTTDIFDGFHIVLLGDIHKRQILQTYYEADGGVIKPAIAYPSSLIQQNHGESLNQHGYLLWDVANRSFTEFDVKNDYGYYTMDIVNGIVPSVTDMPLKPRLRIRVSNTDPSQIKGILTEIKKQYNVEEFTVTRVDTISRRKTDNFDNSLLIGDVRNVGFQNELIRDYLERRFFADSNTIERIQDINKQINSKISSDTATPHIQWVAKSFEFSNMFSYGENNTISFDNARGIVGIFAPNASGKSSVFDALSFCIFDKTSRTTMAKNVLNNKKSKFYCKFHFQIDNIDYYIERTGNLGSNGKSVKVDVNFWKQEGNSVVSLNGEQRRDTNLIIQQYLGNYDDFVLTALSLQGNNSLFIDKSQSDRKEILAQFMGLNIFDLLHDAATDENRYNASLIKKFKQDDFTEQLANIELSLENLEREYRLTDESLSDSNSVLDIKNQALISLSESIISVNSDNQSLPELTSKKNTLEDAIARLHTDLSETLVKLNTCEAQYASVLDKISNFDEPLIDTNFKCYKADLQKLDELDKKLEILRVKESSALAQREHLEKHKYNPDCDICVQNSENVIDAKTKIAFDLESLHNSIATLEQDRIVLTDSINSNKPYEALYSELKTLKLEEATVSSTINSINTNLSNLQTKHIRLESDLKQVVQLIDNYLQNELQIEKNKQLRAEILAIKSEMSILKSNSDALGKKLLSLSGQLSSLKSQRDLILGKISEIESLESEQKLFEYYLNALSKDGISYELISKTLPLIEGEVNNILSQMVEFGLELEMDGKNINANIVYDDQKWGLEMCSGMERFISGLAMRIALINVCNLPRPNFLVIDEGFGTLDSENLTSLYMLFDYLKTQFEFVMIISHIDSMRDVVDVLMEIKKENGFSNIVF